MLKDLQIEINSIKDTIIFTVNRYNKLFIVGVFLIITLIYLFSGETNEEKIVRVVQEYNEERMRKTTRLEKENQLKEEEKAKLTTIIDANTKCIERMNAQSGSVIKPDCTDLYSSGTTTIVDTAKADMSKTINSPKPFTWRLNSSGQSKPYSELCGTLKPSECTFEKVLEAHRLPLTPFLDGEKQYKVYKETVLCIAWADSGLGKYLKSKNNIGNVGNNDRGQTVEYKTLDDGILAIFNVLNGTYLKHKQSIGSLSPGGGGNSPFYATSQENWNVNVLNCLNVLVDKNITEDSTFRF